MKVPVWSSLVLSLGLSAPLFAIERPKSLDDELPKEPAENRAVEVAEPKGKGKVEEMPRVGVRPAWMGVFSESADETLTHQLGVDGGVVLRFVAEGSPAEEAGLKVHDLLTTIDGEAIANQHDLRAVVGEHDAGDEIKLGVVSRGVKSEKLLKLGERPEGLMQLQQDPRFNGGAVPIPGGRMEDLKRQMQELNRLFPNGDLQKRMEKQMKQMEEQLKDLEKMPGFKMELELDELLDELPNKKNGFNFNLKSAGSVKLMDDQGSVEMKMRDGGREVEVRDKERKLLYEGPWDTEQDKAAVAPEIRERIEKLNFGVGGNAKGFQLRIGPGGGIEIPEDLKLQFNNGDVPEEEEGKAEPEEKD